MRAASLCVGSYPLINHLSPISMIKLSSMNSSLVHLITTIGAAAVLLSADATKALARIPSGLNLEQNLLAQSCPFVSGSFRRGTDNMIIHWVQDGCNISSNAPSRGFDHAIRGLWAGSYFDFTVVRQNIQNGCTTQMYGRLFKINDFQIQTEIYGSDGRCDLPPNYTENSVWTRI